jgi:hypothetical protein
MNRRDRDWVIVVAAGLLVIFAILMTVHWVIFRDAHYLTFYILEDVVFLPLQVLIVVLIIERILSLREKRALAHKLNMVIGAFFSELGSPLLAELLPSMEAAPEISERLRVQASWKKEDFSRASQYARELKCEIDLDRIDLTALKTHLVGHRQFILRLLENPNLLEHDRFTDLLWAVLHLEEELEARSSLVDMRPADEAHLRVDMRRAFNQLVAEWVLYVSHLKEDYPYLFSLVVRIHPFQHNPSAEVVSP